MPRSHKKSTCCGPVSSSISKSKWTTSHSSSSVDREESATSSSGQGQQWGYGAYPQQQHYQQQQQVKPTKLQRIGCQLVQLASQLAANLSSLTTLPAGLLLALNGLATALSNVGIALQSSPCCKPAENILCLLNCILLIVLNLLVAVGASAAPGVSFSTVLALLARIQCVLSQLSGAKCVCVSFCGGCPNSLGNNNCFGGSGRRHKRKPVEKCASLSSTATASVASSSAGSSASGYGQFAVDPCALLCAATFQTLAAGLAVIAALLTVGAGGASGTLFTNLGLVATSLQALSNALIAADNSVVSCISTATPCLLPCALGTVLTALIPTLSAVANNASVVAVPTAASIVTAAQNALIVLTGPGCLPSVLSPCATVSQDVSGALAGFMLASDLLYRTATAVPLI